MLTLIKTEYSISQNKEICFWGGGKVKVHCIVTTGLPLSHMYTKMTVSIEIGAKLYKNSWFALQTMTNVHIGVLDKRSWKEM